MDVDVISDRERARKRGGALGWAARRFGALLLTIGVLAGVSFVAPFLRPSPAPAPDPVIVQVEALRDGKWPGLTKPVAKPDMPVQAQVVTPRRRRGVSLNVPHEPLRGDDFEVLSAAELDAISQAHQAALPSLQP